MAALEYEVREEYKGYSIAQLLESPVTCFQGVGDIQSDLLQRYFSVATVKDLAEFTPFVQALNVQETVLEGGTVLEQTVAEVAGQRELKFQIRSTDQVKRIVELPVAPVHVLDGLTPAQDLALYDAFRITNLTQLAQNRIMLEARVIEYLSGHEEDGDTAAGSSDAVAAILGARAATAASGQARARSGEFGEGDRAQELAGEVTDHVRDRIAAMRDRAQDRAASQTGAGAPSTTSRLDAIRGSRDRGGDVAGRGIPSRADGVLAGRSGAAETRSLASRRAEELGARGGGSRADSVTSARQVAGRSGPPQAAGGGATVRTRTPPSGAAAGGARGAAATTAATATGGAAEATLPTEQEAAAAAAAAAEAAAEARRRQQRNPMPLIAAAVIAVIVVGGLIWYFAARSGPPQMDTTAGGPGQTQTGMAGAPGQQTGMAGASGQQAGQGEAQPGGATGPAGAAAMPKPAEPPPPVMKGTHTVGRGDSLWFISEKEYADPLNWPSIFMENKDKIRNPDLIFPRQELRIPAKPLYRFPEYPKGYRAQR